MSRTRVPNTDHAYFRAAERCGWTRYMAKRMMKDANRYGKTFIQVDNKELAEFMKARQVSTRRRIKYYLGYIFVFASTSTRCYTVYKYEGVNPNESNETR